MLVARTIFLTPGGGLWKMFCWSIMGMLECTGKSNQSQTHPADLLPVLSPLEMGTPAASGHSQQLPASQTPGKYSTSHLGSLNSVASTCGSSAAEPVPEPGGTPGISLAEMALPPIVQVCSCPSSRVPWDRGTGILTATGPTLTGVALSKGPWLSCIPALPCHSSAPRKNSWQRRAGIF